jgi:signal transduction histidine kinase
VLLVLLVSLAVLVYREMIMPLRRKLVESHAIIQRQEKLASLGVLAAGVAHEIRNPLTAIKARLFTQRKALNPGSPAFEDTVVISKEIDRLERIVKDVLEFARPPEPNLVALSADVPPREAAELMTLQLEKSGIDLKVDGLARIMIQADPEQLKQVLINLIQNAAESIGRNGTITLRARTATERLNGQPHPAVILEVEDTGKGISPEVERRLFDPFFSTKEGGTGLGLAIAARIVEKHGGTLQFRTRLNQGTTFAIVLPKFDPK